MTMSNIDVADFVVFCDRTLTGYARAIDEVNDVTLNQSLPVDGSNTPSQLVVHATSACLWWCRQIVLGLPVDRDRAAEFEAAASKADLMATIERTRAELRVLAPQLDAARTLAVPHPRTQIPLEQDWTVGAALFHAYEELAQHLGHLEVTLDVLTA